MKKHPFAPKATHALNHHYDSTRTPRRRAHDVVMWMEDDEYKIYDGVSDLVYHYPKNQKYQAINKFNSIKSSNDGIEVNKII